jgi:hypothetical protein
MTDALRSNRLRQVVVCSVTGIGSYRVMVVKIANIDASRGSLAARDLSMRSRLRCWTRLLPCRLIPSRFAAGLGRLPPPARVRSGLTQPPSRRRSDQVSGRPVCAARKASRSADNATERLTARLE